jgi:hypothetical protein
MIWVECKVPGARYISVTHLVTSGKFLPKTVNTDCKVLYSVAQCNVPEIVVGRKQNSYSLCKFMEVVNVEANLPIMTRAGTAFHSSQNVMKEDVTSMMPGMKTVVK